MGQHSALITVRADNAFVKGKIAAIAPLYPLRVGAERVPNVLRHFSTFPKKNNVIAST